VCSGRAARAVDVPVARIEHTLHLSGAQADALRELKDASAKAATSACARMSPQIRVLPDYTSCE
jgi:hypothetical protein